MKYIIKNKLIKDTTRIQLPFNFENFENGECNVLLITGNRYIGKSTLAEKFAEKYKAIHIELDNIDFGNPEFKFHDTQKIEYKWLIEFLKDHKDLKNIIEKFGDLRPEQYDELMSGFIPYLINKCLEDKNNKYIIEGIQIYRFSEYIDNTLPIIILISEKNYNKLVEEGDIDTIMGVLRQLEYQIDDNEIKDSKTKYKESDDITIYKVNEHYEARHKNGDFFESADLNELNELENNIYNYEKPNNKIFEITYIPKNDDRVYTKIIEALDRNSALKKFKKNYQNSVYRTLDIRLIDHKIIKITDDNNWVSIYKGFDIYYDDQTKEYTATNKNQMTSGKTINEVMKNIRNNILNDIKDLPKIENNNNDLIVEIKDLLDTYAKLKAMYDASYIAIIKANEYNTFKYSKIAHNNRENIKNEMNKIENKLEKEFYLTMDDSLVITYLDKFNYYVKEYDIFYNDYSINTFLNKIFR